MSKATTPFTLVYDQNDLGETRDKVNDGWADAVARITSPDFLTRSREFADALLKIEANIAAVSTPVIAASMLALLFQKRALLRAPKPVLIGLWDLDAWVGRLRDTVEQLNAAQGVFRFYDIIAAVPVGLVSKPDRVRQWLETRESATGLEWDPKKLTSRLIVDDFIPMAQRIKLRFGLDHLVGLTPSLIAGEDDDGLYLDRVSIGESGALLVSTDRLRRRAASSGISFESLLMERVLARWFVAHFPRLSLHRHRGCILDKESLRPRPRKRPVPWIEPRCLELIPAHYRIPVLNLLRAVTKLKGS